MLNQYSPTSPKGWDSKSNTRHVQWGCSNALHHELVRKLSDNSKLLDIGCGTGKVYRKIRTEKSLINTKIDMVDISPSMCNYASKVAENDPFARVFNIDISKENHPLANERYDIISMLQLLHHVPDPKMVINHASKLLKPGGCIVSLSLGPKYFKEVFSYHPDEKDPIGRHTLDQWESYFEGKALTHERSVIDSFSMSYDSVGSLVKFAQQVGMLHKLEMYNPGKIGQVPELYLIKQGDSSTTVTGEYITTIYRKEEQ